MNQMKYDVSALGNHEFDFGLDNLERLLRMANFPIVCANYDVKETSLADFIKPYVILARNGLLIGVFGLSPRLEGLVAADKREGVIFKDPVIAANEIATYLKKVKKCDAVVCLSHLGVKEDEILVRKTRNIDVILGGHSHTYMKESIEILNADGHAVPISHTGKNSIWVGKIDLTFEK